MYPVSPKRNTLMARWAPLPLQTPWSPAPMRLASPTPPSLGQLRTSPLDSRLVTMALGAGAAVTGGMLAYQMRGTRSVWPTIGIVVAIVGGLKFFHDMANLK